MPTAAVVPFPIATGRIRLVDLGSLPKDTVSLLKRGVGVLAAQRDAGDTAEQAFSGPSANERATMLFGEALGRDPTALPVYFALVRIHTHFGALESALSVGLQGLNEAAHQADLPADWRVWSNSVGTFDAGPGQFGLKLLRAMAYVQQRRGKRIAMRALIDKCEMLEAGLGSEKAARPPRVALLPIDWERRVLPRSA